MDINNIQIDDVPTTAKELAAYDEKFNKPTQKSIDEKMSAERKAFLDKQPSDTEMEEKIELLDEGDVAVLVNYYASY